MAATMLENNESTYAINDSEVATIEKTERLDRCRPDIAAVAIVCAGCPMLRFCPKFEAELEPKPATIELVDDTFEIPTEQGCDVLASTPQDPFTMEIVTVGVGDTSLDKAVIVEARSAEVSQKASYLERLLDDSIDVVVADSIRQVPIETMMQHEAEESRIPEVIVPAPSQQEIQTEVVNVVIAAQIASEAFIVTAVVDEPEMIVLPVPAIITELIQIPIPTTRIILKHLVMQHVEPIFTEHLIDTTEPAKTVIPEIMPEVVPTIVAEPVQVIPIVEQVQFVEHDQPTHGTEILLSDEYAEPLEIDLVETMPSIPILEMTRTAIPILDSDLLVEQDNERVLEVHNTKKDLIVAIEPQRYILQTAAELDTASRTLDDPVEQNPERRLIQIGAGYNERLKLLQRVALGAMRRFIEQRQYSRIGI